MTAGIDITSILGQIVSIVNNAYLTLVSLFWYYTVKYGLSPRYAYGSVINPPSSFLSFYSYIMNSLYAGVLEFGFIFAALSIIVKNSLGIPSRTLSTIIRYSVSLAIFIASYRISLSILLISKYAYSYLWNYRGINWYNIFSALNTLHWNAQSSGGHGPLIEFFFLSGYFIATFALMAMLLIREALTYFLIVALPIFSVLLIFRSTQEYSVRLWKLFVESSVLPLLVIVVLIIDHSFGGDYLLQLAFLSIASSMPLLIAGGSRIFSASVLSPSMALGNLKNISGRGTSAVNTGLRSISGGTVATLPSTSMKGLRKGADGPIKFGRGKDTNLDWGKIGESDRNYRKAWTNGRE